MKFRKKGLAKKDLGPYPWTHPKSGRVFVMKNRILTLLTLMIFLLTAPAALQAEKPETRKGSKAESQRKKQARQIYNMKLKAEQFKKKAESFEKAGKTKQAEDFRRKAEREEAKIEQQKKRSGVTDNDLKKVEEEVKKNKNDKNSDEDKDDDVDDNDAGDGGNNDSNNNETENSNKESGGSSWFNFFKW